MKVKWRSVWFESLNFIKQNIMAWKLKKIEVHFDNGSMETFVPVYGVDRYKELGTVAFECKHEYSEANYKIELELKNINYIKYIY